MRRTATTNSQAEMRMNNPPVMAARNGALDAGEATKAIEPARQSRDSGATRMPVTSCSHRGACGRGSSGGCDVSMRPNAGIKPTRVAEQTAWQAVPAMLFVERHEFGLNELLGAWPMGEAPPRRKLLRSGARWKPGEQATVRADGLACQCPGRSGRGELLPGPDVWSGERPPGRGPAGAKCQGAYAPTRCCRSAALAATRQWLGNLDVAAKPTQGDCTSRLTPKLSRIAARSWPYGKLFLPYGRRSDAISA